MRRVTMTSAHLLQYGFLAAPVAFAGFPLYVLAPDFYATNYGLTLSGLGIVLLFLRLFDAFQDPFIGFMSDLYRSKISAILILSAVILVFSIYGLFTQSYLSPLIWFSICMGFAVTSYSVLSINLNALGALWTEDRNAQTSIAAIREAFGLLGLVVAVSLPGLLSNIVPKEHVYEWFGLALAFIMAVALVFFLRWHSRTLKTETIPKSYASFFLSLSGISTDSRKLLFVYLVSMIASSIPAVLVIFFVRDLLGAESYTGFFLLLYFVSGAFFMPVWKRISRKHGKYRSWFFSMLVASGGFIWAFFLGPGDLWQYGVICIASGAALGADLVFPPSILADQLHASKSESHASTHYATLTLTAKSSLALASAFSLPLLEGFGFTPGVANSSSALFGLSACYALLPCVLKVSAALLLFRTCLFTQKKESLMKITKLTAIIGSTIILGGCGGNSVEYYKGTTPEVNIKEYFNGPIKAWGIVQDWRGRVIRRFDVSMVGTWKGDTGTLIENFDYYDGEKQERVWTIKKLSDGRYEGTAPDIIGKALGTTEGSSARWVYVMDLPVNETTYRIRFDDWMWVMNDGVLINRSYLKKFGFTVSELTIFMQKQNPIQKQKP